MTVDYLFSRFTVMNYIADYTEFTDHSETPYYAGSSYYVLKTYYLKTGTEE